MHFKEHSPLLSTNSASSLIGSGNGSASNSMHSNQNMVSPSFPRSRYGLPTFSTKKGIGCTSGQNLLAPSHQCNHGPTWIALSFFAFYNCLCYHASTKISISGGICYIAIKYLALSYGFWILSFGIKSQNWEYWCSSISIYPWVYPWAYILEYEYISLSIYPCVWVYILEYEYISFWPLLGPLGNATHWGRSRKCLAIVCLSNHLPLQSTRK